MFNFFKVRGDSLYPILKTKEIVFCLKVFKFVKLNIDDIIIFKKNNYGLMIKKIKKIDGEKYFVEGTSVNSIDSRDFGEINLHDIKYKVFFKL